MPRAVVMDLPVHAGCSVVKDLHPVHPHIPLSVLQAPGKDLGKRDVLSPIIRPALHHGKKAERGAVFDDDLSARTVLDGLRGERGHLYGL